MLATGPRDACSGSPGQLLELVLALAGYIRLLLFALDGHLVLEVVHEVFRRSVVLHAAEFFEDRCVAFVVYQVLGEQNHLLQRVEARCCVVRLVALAQMRRYLAQVLFARTRVLARLLERGNRVYAAVELLVDDLNLAKVCSVQLVLLNDAARHWLHLTQRLQLLQLLVVLMRSLLWQVVHRTDLLVLLSVLPLIAGQHKVSCALVVR